MSNYMHQSSRTSLLKEVETEILQQHQTTLLEKEHSGCAALLQDDKVTFSAAGLLCHAAHLKLFPCVSPTCCTMTMQQSGCCSTPVKAMIPCAVTIGCIIAHLWCSSTQMYPCLSQCFVNTTSALLTQPNLLVSCISYWALHVAEKRFSTHVPPLSAHTQRSGACGRELQEARGKRGHETGQGSHRGCHSQEGQRCWQAQQGLRYCSHVHFCKGSQRHTNGSSVTSVSLHVILQHRTS